MFCDFQRSVLLLALPLLLMVFDDFGSDIVFSFYLNLFLASIWKYSLFLHIDVESNYLAKLLINSKICLYILIDFLNT